MQATIRKSEENSTNNLPFHQESVFKNPYIKKQYTQLVTYDHKELMIINKDEMHIVEDQFFTKEPIVAHRGSVMDSDQDY